MRILKSSRGLCLLCDYLEANSIIGGFSILFFFLQLGFSNLNMHKLEYVAKLQALIAGLEWSLSLHF